MTKVLLIEDDLALGAGVAEVLRRAGYAVDHAHCAADALAASRRERYGACLLDLGLPDRDGLDLLSQLRQEGQACPILVMTARDGLDDRVQGLETGADDYLIKPFAVPELVARLRALLRRQASGQAPWQEVGRLRINHLAHKLMAGADEVPLTRREWAVFSALSRSKGRVVTRGTLAEAVFEADADVAPNALELHVSRLRRKIEPHGVTVRALRGLGYRLDELGVRAPAHGPVVEQPPADGAA
jgi:DNA-binding response OmpR family regulator